jgi:DNA-binding NarL/FixJ family response regulator
MKTVLVISQDPQLPVGIEGLLQAEPDIRVVTSSSAAGEVSSLAVELQPDVVILEADPVGTQALEALRAIAGVNPALPVVVLGHGASILSEALRAGAAAVLPSEVDGKTLRATLEAVQNGLLVLARDAVQRVLPAPMVRTPLEEFPVETLTPREAEVLRLLAQGMTNRRIGQALGISDNTVKFHVASLLGKLDARTRTELAAKANRMGLVFI